MIASFAVLYAPTFRDAASKTEFEAPMVDFVDYAEAASLLGDDYVLLVRGHHMNARSRDRVGSRGAVIDVTDYPEIVDLVHASDVAVLDYSSLRFDYALTGKPMIFLVPDLEEYEAMRGGLIPYEPTAPGPFVNGTAELVSAVAEAARRGTADYGRFLAEYMPLEDGNATERFCSLVFGTARDAR